MKHGIEERVVQGTGSPAIISGLNILFLFTPILQILMLDSWTMAERDYQLGFRFFSALNCYLLISMLVFIKLMIQRLRAICIKQGRSSTKIVGGEGGGGWKGLKKYRPPW